MLHLVAIGLISYVLLNISDNHKAKKAFISFDFDNDEFLRTALVGQAKKSDTPFKIQDLSLKEHLTGNWKEKVRARIRRCDVVIVICGANTHTARGVAAELSMAQELGKPYFLLKGYPKKSCTRPTTAKNTDIMHKWTWKNLKTLLKDVR